MPTQFEVTASLTYSQAGRAIRVFTPLGDDALLLESFEGEDEIAGGFVYTLGMLGKDPSISAAKMIRMPVKVELTLGSGGTRIINGVISKFKQLEQAEGLTVYEAEIRPWWWFLSLSSDFRIFQNMSIPDIIKEVTAGGLVSFKCIKPHPPHDYRVQYGETHLDFMQRLMEEEGIFYYFEHSDNKCTLVVADDNSAIKTAVKLRMSTVAHDTEAEDVLQSFTKQQEVVVGKNSATDYNFETPSTSLLTSTAGNHPSEVMEFPGGFGTKDDGTRLSRIRHEEIVAEQVEAEGKGRCRAVQVGVKVEVSKHSSKDVNGTYLVTSVKESAKLGDFRTNGDPGFAYSNSFTATPIDTPYRPPRTTPQPRAYGYETAVVVGPAGEEIYTDKYGRVKVQFFWDRRGKKDDKSSCWMRVSTPWAGKGWGAIHIPRIGQEVLVAFLDGDPENPIIVGRLWNAEQMPPYALPANKTQSGIKTRSTLQGTPDNFNEIRFEDKKGSEQLFIHGEKNVDIEVEHDQTHWVGHDRTKTIDHDETTTVKNDRTESVEGNESISIGGNRTESVGKNESITISKNRQESVGEGETVSIGKDRNHAVGNNDALDVSADQSISIGKKLNLQVADARSTSIGKNDELTVGKKLVISAADEITLTAGDASIVMKKNGEITITGKDITVSGSGKINVKASSDLVLKGSKVAAN